LAEALASIGAVAAGGAFVGTAFGLVLTSTGYLNRADRLEGIGVFAAHASVMAVGLAIVETAVT